MKQPKLEDFGVTPEQYALYVRNGIQGDVFGLLYIPSSVISVAVVVTVVILTTGDKTIAGWAAFGSLFFVAPIVSGILVIPVCLIDWLIERFNSWRILKAPILSRIKQYEEAQAAYNVAQSEASKAQQEADRQRQEAERQQREAERARRAVLLAQQRKREQYWKSLGGKEFERELGKLFAARATTCDTRAGLETKGATLF